MVLESWCCSTTIKKAGHVFCHFNNDHEYYIPVYSWERFHIFTHFTKQSYWQQNRITKQNNRSTWLWIFHVKVPDVLMSTAINGNNWQKKIIHYNTRFYNIKRCISGCFWLYCATSFAFKKKHPETSALFHNSLITRTHFEQELILCKHLLRNYWIRWTSHKFLFSHKLKSRPINQLVVLATNQLVAFYFFKTTEGSCQSTKKKNKIKIFSGQELT